ncbi:hypothetical protein CKAH01_12198 [Colletotrichum kahawae]|uniref:DUF6546 domain-containing protein n=1 Tax=Colletotrichum kahawae TaxID=34407 RepID=A0AAD9YS92_COLKA|nr:hypothetical protein CKAH01_12198 [Colletotrichum kahawae]
MAGSRPNLSSLPPELNLFILQELANLCNEDYAARPGMGAYASVCKNWQMFFEPLVFKHFTLAREDLSEFRQVTQDNRRRSLVRHIWLRLEEPSALQHSELGLEQYKWSQPYFTDIIWNLWTTISQWKVEELAEFGGQQGLTLELSSHKYFPTQEDTFIPQEDYRAYSQSLGNELSAAYKTVSKFYFNAPLYGWDLSTKAKRDLFCKGVRVDSRPLPQVEVVTGFFTRRAYTQNVRPEVLFLIFDSLPRAKDIRIERWRHGLVACENEWRNGMQVDLPHHVPASLETLAIFEEKGPRNGRFNLIPNDKLTESVILGILHLKHLCLCFFINGDEFFQKLSRSDMTQRLSGRGYQELTSLTLTSLRLKAKIDENWDMLIWRGGVTELLQMAAAATKLMPKLRLMEVWNGGDGNASVFRYEVSDDNKGEISWQSTQNCEPFEQEVIEAWEKVAQDHGLGGLTIRPSTLLSGDFTYYGSIIPLLTSKEEVVHPMSVAQMT